MMKNESLIALVEYLAISIVDDPSLVEVKEARNGNQVKLELRVANDDMGRIIGKRGRVANSIRLLLNVAAARQGLRANLDVVEPF